MPALWLERRVLPERLDAMAPNDPDAQRSRRDLQRVHRVMGSLTMLRRAMRSLFTSQFPQKILELGAGDGSLMLRFAQSVRWPDVEVTFLDRQDLISTETCEQLGRIDWKARSLTEDALEWAREDSAEQYDLCVTTLFLHHFRSAELGSLLRAVAARCRYFVALEPRRNSVAWIGSHLLGLLGANAVTREDGVTSVVAGFAGHELSAMWPSDGAAWRLREHFAWPFTHYYLAARVSVTDWDTDARRR